MDAQAYLQKHGWRGHGHSLDQSGRGIKKPLLVSRKVDVLGVGLNKHAAVSDQWWLRAFDNGLKNFGTGQESMLATVQKHGVNRGGLYGRFVKGEGVASTFDELSPNGLAVSNPNSPAATDTKSSENMAGKRKRNGGAAEGPESKQQKTMAPEEQKTMAPEEHRQTNINQATKALVREAEIRGIIPTNGKQKRKVTDTSPDDPLLAMVNHTRLSEYARLSGSDQATNAVLRTARQQIRSEFKDAAKAYLMGTVVHDMPVKLATEQILGKAATKKASKISGKEQSRIDHKTKAANRVAKKQAKIAKRMSDVAEIVALKASRNEPLTVREAAAACGIKPRQYIKLSTGKPYRFWVNDSKQTPMTLEEWVEMNRTSRPELELSDKALGHAFRFDKKHKTKTTVPMEPVTNATKHHSAIAEKTTAEQDQIDAYRARKRGLTLEEYRHQAASGGVRLPAVDTSIVDASKLVEYQKRADEKGISLTAYIKRREEKYAAKQGEKLKGLLQP